MVSQVTAEELSGNDDYVELAFSAKKLDDKVRILKTFITHALFMNKEFSINGLVVKLCQSHSGELNSICNEHRHIQ